MLMHTLIMLDWSLSLDHTIQPSQKEFAMNHTGNLDKYLTVWTDRWIYMVTNFMS